MKKIYLSPPHMSGKELEYIKEVFDQNWIAPIGPHLNKFEDMIKEYTGTKHAVAVTSGTAGIHLALKTLGVNEGDTVICSDFTFIGSVNPILYCNATPVFIDSEGSSWNMDPFLLERGIQECISNKNKPKAIILVHIFGITTNINKIIEISKKYNIPIIEDAAESLGSLYQGIQTGTLGDIGVYSFNGNKLLTTSGGGMVVTNNKEYAQKIKFLSTQAKDDVSYYQHSEIGFNYRLSNVLAAIGIAQMEIIEKRITKTRKIHNIYTEELGDVINFLIENHGDRSNNWLTCGTLKNSTKKINELISLLNKSNIESRRLWNPMHLQPLLKNFKFVTTHNISNKLFDTGLCLPSGTNLTEGDLDRIIKIVRLYLNS